MFAHGRETVSAQCLLPFVDAGESVSRPCLARGAPRNQGILETVCRGHEGRARPLHQASLEPPRSINSRRRGPWPST
jgi:hypothetical protein